MKDGPEGDVLTSKLEHVEIGTDDDGDTISSCVAVEAEPAPATGKRKLSNAKSRALDALSNAIAEHGKRATASLQLPADVQVVSVDQWRAECFATGALKKDDKNSRATFKRFGDALAARKIIAERNGFLWIC